MAHRHPDRIELRRSGPVGDRLFCLVDDASGQVIRTAENAALMACRATWRAPRLTIETPIGAATDVVSTRRPIMGDYWGRAAPLTVIDGPWNRLLTRYLDRAVNLCRVERPGAVVWSGSVSLVTTASVADVTARLAEPHAIEPASAATDADHARAAARFRATFVVAGAEPAFVEDAWVGRRLRIGGPVGAGGVVVRVDGRMPRCAVVDRDPALGQGAARVLGALAADRIVGGEIVFGVQGTVERAGVVVRGDPVVLLDEPAAGSTS